jgi:hypothetical protein
MNTFQILASQFRFDLMHWNVSIGRFLTLFPLKRPARHEKNTSNMAATIGDVMDDVTCKCFIGHGERGQATPLSHNNGHWVAPLPLLRMIK